MSYLIRSEKYSIRTTTKRGSMKKIILMVGILVLSYGSANAFWPFPDLKIDTKIQTLKDSMSKEFSDIKAGVNDVKAGINDVKATVSGNTTELGVVKDNQLKLTAKVNANINAGYQTNANTTVGGNQSVATTNDSTLIQSIFKIFSGVALAIISAMGVIVKMQGTLISKLTDDNSKLLSDSDADYDRLVAFQSQMLSDIIKSKDDYKDRYLKLVDVNTDIKK